MKSPLRRTLTGLVAAALGVALLGGTLSPAAAAPEELRLKDLPRGDAPSTPYVVDRTLVDGDVSVALPKGVTRFVGKVGPDYLLHGFDSQDNVEVMVRITPAGVRTDIARSMSFWDAELSPDGTSFVASKTTRSRTTVIKRYDAGTGDVTRKTTLRGYGQVLDFDGTRVAVGIDRPNRTVAWNVETDRTSVLARLWGYEADLANDRLASLTKDPYLNGCSVVSRISDGAELWRSCDEAVETFSADGTHIATVHILSDGLGPGRFTLRKVTGKKLGVFDAPYYFGRIWFEDGNHVLADTYSKTKGAVVRCDGAGCERASAISPHDAP